MNSEPSLPDLYRAHGFTITPHLQALIDTYGETEVISPVDPKTIVITHRDGSKSDFTHRRSFIWFCIRNQIKGGHHEEAEAFMGLPMAPVGLANDYSLYLADDGRLVGEYDGVMVTWGPRGCDWRASIAAFLEGAKDRPIGDCSPRDPLPQEEQDMSLKELYRSKGFTLTPHLLALIEAYGETVLMPPGEEAPLRADGTLDWARAPEEVMEFRIRDLITLGADFRLFKGMDKFLGSPVAPVGYTYGQNIKLYLTEDGRLIGYHNSTLKAWGPEGCDWRTSIAARLAGEPARKLGVVQW